MASGDMARNADNIPHSAMYTAATWKWGGVPCAEITTPEGSDRVFSLVNIYMKLYRFINPGKYSLHHMLLHRHAMINHLLETSQYPQVIEVAAGFSPRGSHVSENPAVSYFEVDLPAVVTLKRNQLEKTEQGRAVLARDNFQQRACNILQLDFSEQFEHRPSFILTEGLMMYFSREEQLAIWQRVAEYIRANGGEYVFDYIPLDIEPKRSWIGRVLHCIKEALGGDGQEYSYDERSLADVKQDLLAAGFQQVDIYESPKMAAEWQLPYANVKTHVAVYRCR